MSADSTLYDALGGRDAIAAVVDEFYRRVLDDDRLAVYFEETDLGELRSHQTAFLSAVTGGPVEYGGDGMREAHAHLDLSEEDFDRVATHLRASLQAFDVGEREVERVMETVASLEGEILAR